MLFVPKLNGKLRFCLDYRALNERTQQDAGPIANQEEIIDSKAGVQLFSALCSGCYEIPLDVESRAFTAFPTPFGLDQWTSW